MSWKDGRSVLAKLYDRFLNSLPLFIVGTLITWTLSFPVGIQAAIRRGGVYDRTTTFFAYLLISIPGFFFAYMLIIFVVSTFHVPVIGMKTFGLSGAGVVTRVMDRVWHLVIPSILGATAGIAVLSRYVRNQMMEVEGQDYVRTARAKGLPEEQVHYKHALRNALLPFVTMFGLVLPGLIGGSVIIESIFAWPGIGRLAYEAILARDYPLILQLILYQRFWCWSGPLSPICSTWWWIRGLNYRCKAQGTRYKAHGKMEASSRQIEDVGCETRDCGI